MSAIGSDSRCLNDVTILRLSSEEPIGSKTSGCNRYSSALRIGRFGFLGIVSFSQSTNRHGSLAISPRCGSAFQRSDIARRNCKGCWTTQCWPGTLLTPCRARSLRCLLSGGGGVDDSQSSLKRLRFQDGASPACVVGYKSVSQTASAARRGISGRLSCSRCFRNDHDVSLVPCLGGWHASLSSWMFSRDQSSSSSRNTEPSFSRHRSRHASAADRMSSRYSWLGPSPVRRAILSLVRPRAAGRSRGRGSGRRGGSGARAGRR